MEITALQERDLANGNNHFFIAAKALYLSGKSVSLTAAVVKDLKG